MKLSPKELEIIIRMIEFYVEENPETMKEDAKHEKTLQDLVNKLDKEAENGINPHRTENYHSYNRGIS